MSAWSPAYAHPISDSMDLLSPGKHNPIWALPIHSYFCMLLFFDRFLFPDSPSAVSPVLALPGDQASCSDCLLVVITGALQSQSRSQGGTSHLHSPPNTSLPQDLPPQIQSGLSGCPFPQLYGCLVPLTQPLNFHTEFLGGTLGAGFGSLPLPGPSLCPPPLSGRGFGFPTPSNFARPQGPQFNPAVTGLVPGPISAPGTPTAGRFRQSAIFNFTSTTSTPTPIPTQHPFTTQLASSTNSDSVGGNLLQLPNPPSSFPFGFSPADPISEPATAHFSATVNQFLSPWVAHHDQLVLSARTSRPAPPHRVSQNLESVLQASNQEPNFEFESSNPSRDSGSSHRRAHAQEVEEELDDTDDADESEEDERKITVDSLLGDTMPATSRKRSRVAASLDDAGPSETKRRRSPSSTATPARPSKTTRSRRSVRVPVVIPDSDDVFSLDDDVEQAKLFDLTKDDNIPDELMEAPKEDSSVKLVKFECVICMDSSTNLTVTHCG